MTTALRQIDPERLWRQQVAARFAEPQTLPAYTVATLPAAASWLAALIYVSNESGGAVPAFSDGTNWRRVTDRAIVS